MKGQPAPGGGRAFRVTQSVRISAVELLVAEVEPRQQGWPGTLVDMSTDLASDLLRWAGVTCAAVGALVVAPHVVTIWRVTLRRQRRVVLVAARAHARRAMQVVLRRPGRVASVSGTAHARATAIGAVSSTEHALPFGVRSSLEVRVGHLENVVNDVRERVRSAERALQFERDQRAAALVDVERRLTGALVELRRHVDEQAARGEQLDARGMPLVGGGIVLTGVPDGLAALGPAVFIPVLVVASAAVGWGAVAVLRAWLAGAPVR